MPFILSFSAVLCTHTPPSLPRWHYQTTTSASCYPCPPRNLFFVHTLFVGTNACRHGRLLAQAHTRNIHGSNTQLSPNEPNHRASGTRVGSSRMVSTCRFVFIHDAYETTPVFHPSHSFILHTYVPLFASHIVVVLRSVAIPLCFHCCIVPFPPSHAIVQPHHSNHRVSFRAFSRAINASRSIHTSRIARCTCIINQVPHHACTT